MLDELYKNKRCLVTGQTGFIGSAITKRLTDLGAIIVNDVDQRLGFVFHFAGPSSQVLFSRKPGKCIDDTIMLFNAALDVSRKTGAKLVYPSTGLLSSKQPLNEYAQTKKLTEAIARREAPNSLGIRLFAAYGSGERHKLDYASVPYLFTRAAVYDQEIVVYGDGEQTRDFIYIDDAVKAILTISAFENGVVDVESGEATSFNQIIDHIRNYVSADTKVIHVDKPSGYVENTLADTTIMQQYNLKCETQMREGIIEIVKKL